VVVADGPAASLVRGGPGDNVSAILGRLHGAPPGPAPARASASSLPSLVVRGGSLQLTDNRKGLSVTVGVVDASWETGLRFRVDARQVSGRFGSYGTESNPAFGAESLTLQGSLAGPAPGSAGLRLRCARATCGLWQPLPLTGHQRCGSACGSGVRILCPRFWICVLFRQLRRAKRALWTATGQLRPSIDSRSLEGTLSLRAERFSLDKIAEILPASVLEPENTERSTAAIEAKLEAGVSHSRASWT